MTRPDSAAHPFAVGTDIEQGEVVPLNQGDAARAVLASCAVPGLYAPVRTRQASGQWAGGQSPAGTDGAQPRRHALAARAPADLVITPEIRTPSQLGLTIRAWGTEAGKRAAGAQLHEIRALFESA